MSQYWMARGIAKQKLLTILSLLHSHPLASSIVLYTKMKMAFSGIVASTKQKKQTTFQHTFAHVHVSVLFSLAFLLASFLLFSFIFFSVARSDQIKKDNNKFNVTYFFFCCCCQECLMFVLACAAGVPLSKYPRYFFFYMYVSFVCTNTHATKNHS